MNRMVESFLGCSCALSQNARDTFLSSAEFAFNSLRLDTTGQRSFESNFGWSSTFSLNVLSTKLSSAIQSVETILQTLESSIICAKCSHKLAQATCLVDMGEDDFSYHIMSFVLKTKLILL